MPDKITILLTLITALVTGVAILFERRLINMEHAFLDKRCTVKYGDYEQEIGDRITFVLQREIKKYQNNSSSAACLHTQKNIVTNEHLETLKAFFNESVAEIKRQNGMKTEQTKSTNPNTGESSEGWIPFLLSWLSWIYMCLYRIMLTIAICLCGAAMFNRQINNDSREALFLFMIFSVFGAQPSALLSIFLPIENEEGYPYIVYRFLLGPYRIMWACVSFQIFKTILGNTKKKKLIIPAGIFLYSGLNAYALYT